MGSNRHRAVPLLLLMLTCAGGCSSFQRSTVSPTCFQSMCNTRGPKSDLEPINFLRLRQDPPPVYILGPEDILGVFIEGVVGKRDEPPPVIVPQPPTEQTVTPNIPPAIGFPMPIRDDGTISLPLVPPIQVAGLTLAQAEREIRRAYTITQKILVPNRDRIIVTLIRPRTYRVLVVREDTRGSAQFTPQGRGELFIGSQQRGTAKLVELPAYENDVLHALSASGGLPGLESKNEVTILRGAFEDAAGANALIDKIRQNPNNPELAGSRNILRIPLRARPGEELPIVRQEDIILGKGDIVFIQSREAEVFYTGGLLNGGQFPIPRDFDLDVLGAVAMSGGSIAASAGGSGTTTGARAGVGSIFPPTRVIVLREVNGRQVAIEIDLRRAIMDPCQRILVQPNDFILLEYRPMEIVWNVLLNNLNLTLNLDNLSD